MENIHILEVFDSNDSREGFEDFKNSVKADIDRVLDDFLSSNDITHDLYIGGSSSAILRGDLVKVFKDIDVFNFGNCYNITEGIDIIDESKMFMAGDFRDRAIEYKEGVYLISTEDNAVNLISSLLRFGKINLMTKLLQESDISLVNSLIIKAKASDEGKIYQAKHLEALNFFYAKFSYQFPELINNKY